MKNLINRSIRIAIASIYLAGGFMFFQTNYEEHIKVKNIEKRGVEATAVVKDMSMTKDGICPYVEFEYNSETYGFTGFDNPDLQIGSEVKIKYDPADIHQAAIVSDLTNYPNNFKDSVFGSALFCGICFVVSWFTLTSRRFRLQVA